MTKFFAKWLIRRRIKWAQWDQQYWQSGITVARENARVSAYNVRKAKERETNLRRALIEADYRTPKGLFV